MQNVADKHYSWREQTFYYTCIHKSCSGRGFEVFSVFGEDKLGFRLLIEDGIVTRRFAI